jgi:Domain of unknown function (DUF5753)
VPRLRRRRRPDSLTAALKGLAKETKARGWWHSYGDAIPSWFDVFVALEGAAEEMRMYEAELVPGLFQTAAYAGAVIRRHRPELAPEDLDRRVLLRMHRQACVTREADSTRLDVVLNEAVIGRPVGGPGLRAAQCRHLHELSRLPNVTLPVASASRWPSSTAGGWPCATARTPVRARRSSTPRPSGRRSPAARRTGSSSAPDTRSAECTRPQVGHFDARFA